MSKIDPRFYFLLIMDGSRRMFLTATSSIGHFVGHSVSQLVSPKKFPILCRPQLSPSEAEIWHGGQVHV